MGGVVDVDEGSGGLLLLPPLPPPPPPPLAPPPSSLTGHVRLQYLVRRVGECSVAVMADAGEGDEVALAAVAPSWQRELEALGEEPLSRNHAGFCLVNNAAVASAFLP